MLDVLKSLTGCRNAANVRSAIRGLSAEFGEISHMDILTVNRPGKRQALCLLRLESAAQERRLMTNPGVTRFGSELLYVVDLVAERDSDHDRTSRGEVVQRPENASNENARDKRFWLKPVRWSGTLLVAARRELGREMAWLGKRMT
jgi:hypothetical protein